MTKAMAIDHGRQGIRVNCLCPGDVETPMLDEDARMRGMTWDDYHEQAIGKGADAKALAFVPIEFSNSSVIFGVGSDTNIDQAAVRAIIAGLNRHSKII